MIAKRTVRRETAAREREQGKYRNVIVIVEPSGLLGFKLKGLRRIEYISADVCYEMAVKARVRLEAKEKKKSKIK